MSGIQAPAAVAFLHDYTAPKPSDNGETKSINAEQAQTTKKFAFDIFSGELPDVPMNGVPGTMDPRAMASENHSLVDNWDDAEGYYRKLNIRRIKCVILCSKVVWCNGLMC